MSQNVQIKELETPEKKETNSLFNKNISLLNDFLSFDNKFNPEFLINSNDIKIFNFVHLYFVKIVKIKDIKVLLRHKKIHQNIKFKSNLEKIKNIKNIFSKFLHIWIINSNEISKICGYENSNFIIKIFHLLRIYFLNNLIDKKNLVNFIRLKLYLCFYDKEYNYSKNIKPINIQNKNIVNVSSLEFVINFLLSFTDINLSQKKSLEFIDVINEASDLIKNIFLQNYNNIFLLSNSLLIYKLLELSKISLETLHRTLPLLKIVYKFCFNIDFILNDLSEQFLIKNGENIQKKNNNIIAKNHFLEHLLGIENTKDQNITIKQGFVFNDNPNNGLVFYSNDSFDFPVNGFSIVISFKLMKIQNEENITNKKYTIFSISEADQFQYTKYIIYIEDKKLKILINEKKQKQQILFEDIRYDQSYVLWIFSDIYKKNYKTVFYLNGKKVVKNIEYTFPKSISSINLGFQDYKEQNNFEGIIGTFILFNKCFIKDSESKEYQLFEDIFLKLKFNYEDIIYINYQTEYSLLNTETLNILDQLSSDNISRFIEVIISSKSIVSNDFCCSSKERKIYKANYFINKNEENERASIGFKSKEVCPILDNYNFNSQNCLITYPIHFNDSLVDFINNDGIKFLELELYYFIGVIEYYTLNDENYLKNNSEEFCNYILCIFKNFLFCILNIKQFEQKNEKNIAHFFYTLNNLIELKSKTGFKINDIFLISIQNFLSILIKKINYCEFIFNYERYDVTNDNTLHLLFQTILIKFDEYYTEFLNPNIFTKLLNFSKLYLIKGLKNSKNSYSELIQKLLSKIIIENKTECFSLYLQNIKNLQSKPMTYLYGNITEEISEEPENYFNKKKLSMMSNASRFNNIVKLNEEELEKKKEEKKKEKNDIIILYKLLKNLYLCLDLDKKNNTIEKLFEMCIESGEKKFDFFNNLFNSFKEKYDIIKEESYNGSENDSYDNIKEDDFDDSYDDKEKIYSNEIKEIEINKEHSDDKDKELYKYVELIRALCIRFIDELINEDDIKASKLENPRQNMLKSGSISHSLYNARSTSTSTFFKSASLSNLSNPGRNTLTPESAQFYSNSNKGSLNQLDTSNELIYSKFFKFFNEFTISPYTFNSFFCVIFRNWTCQKKMQFIKIFNNKKKKSFQFIVEKCKNLKETFDLINIVLELIKRVGDEDNDTIFMNNIELLEYCYGEFTKFIFDMLDKHETTSEDIKNTMKALKNTLFCKQDYISKYYLILIESIISKKGKLGTVVINGRIQNTSSSENNKKDQLDNLFKNIEKDLKLIIDKTLYEYVDIFYFKLLFSIYRSDYVNSQEEVYNFVFRIIEYIIDKFSIYEDQHPYSFEKEKEKEKPCDKLVYIKVGLNIKNLLLLIYQITFFNSNRKFLIKNEIFKNNILLYLYSFLQKKKLVYLKIFFPIEERESSTNKTCQKKLIIEMLFEIFFSLYQSYKEDENEQCTQMLEDFIEEFFESGKDDSRKKSKKKTTGGMPKTICYEMDEKNLSKKYNEFTLNFFSYLKDLDPKEQDVSVIILFLIKLTIYIKNLENTEKKSHIIDFFIETSELLCKNAKNLHRTFTKYKPLTCSNSNFTSLYEEFTTFILNDYNLTSEYNKDELISKINFSKKDYKFYTNVNYNKEGKARLTSMISLNLLANEKKNNFEEKSESYCYNKSSLKKYSHNSNSTNELLSLGKEKNRLSIGLFSSKKEKNKNIKYEIIPQFLKNFLRTKFSIYFIKLLTYDEDFIKIRKIYNYLYHKEIDDINKYTLDYPTKLKNRLGNVYVKHFLKKDFNFTSSPYFQYSHKCIFNSGFEAKTKVLFPSKSILEKYDFAHKEIKKIIKNKENKKILQKNCELITYEGSVFGSIYIFENCILFQSDIKNDKRTLKDLDYACCCMEFDFLEKEKTKIIEISEIKKIIPRKFLYSWMSLEIFMKSGKSYLFNFFNENTNEYLLDFLKNKNIKVIKNAKDYFDKKDYSKQWRDGKKSTYDYILILNNFASRTYNDSNQYPLMPWIFLENNKMRNFDIPMSIQEQETKERFMHIPKEHNENRWHSNHYSTSAYICYYLMRINPFTESMIKFQSNNFDVPERQFSDVKQTLLLCAKNNNNREPIPELYTIPEVYINLNYNDFGKQILNNAGRIHNVKFNKFAENAFEFVYKFKYRMNNDEEINTNINMWFDFIFGVNQYNKDNIYGEGLRNFNKYCYGQNINIKKIKEALRKKHKTDSQIFSEIKTILGMIISFGQCPFQILNYVHPKRIYTKGVHNIVMNFADKKKMNKEEQELLQVKEKKEENFFIDYDNLDESTVQKNYDDNSKKNNIIYFHKSIFKNNLYCILNNKDIEVYQKSSWSRDYKFIKKINVPKSYLLFKKNENNFPILKPEFLFCELKEENFIFCRYLDQSIKLVTPNMETQFLLDGFITSVIRISDNEFITGDNKGKISHWRINYDIMNTKLKLIKKLKSNKNSVTAMAYNKKLNIVIITDNNSIVIRSFYDFEFLTYIDINKERKNKNEEINNEETIVDVKCSNYDFVYVLINKGKNKLQEIKGYSLNGICFGKYEEKITNFEITREGRILIGLADRGMILVRHPINFGHIFSRFIISDESEVCLFYHFYFEEPNIIFFGYKDKEGTKIKIVQLPKDEIKYFI